MESPFWKRIRGLGYSYGYGIYHKIDEGLLYFMLSRSTNVVKAYAESVQIIGDLSARSVLFEKIRFDAAKSGSIFEIVSREENYETDSLQVTRSR